MNEKCCPDPILPSHTYMSKLGIEDEAQDLPLAPSSAPQVQLGTASVDNFYVRSRLGAACPGSLSCLRCDVTTSNMIKSRAVLTDQLFRGRAVDCNLELRIQLYSLYCASEAWSELFRAPTVAPKSTPFPKPALALSPRPVLRLLRS